MHPSIATLILLLSSVVSIDANALPPRVLSPLVFSNPVHCARESTLPATSAWLMVDAYNAGKFGYNASLTRRENPDTGASRSVREFRRELGRLARTIADRLSRGELRWIPEAGTEEWKNSEIGRAVERCQGSWKCPEVEQLLQKEWDWMGFRVSARTGREETPIHATSCYRIKEFSALQSHLRQERASREDLESIARTLLNSDQWIEDCAIDSAPEDQRLLIQLDLGVEQGSNTRKFDRVGFSFWTSFKAYLSWAWSRYPEPAWLRSLPLEDMIYLIAPSCRNIDRPKCNAEYTTQQALGWLAQGELEGPLPWVPSETPPGVQQAPAKVTGALAGTEQFVESFQGKLMNRRNEVRHRFSESMLALQTILAKYTPQELFNEAFRSQEFYRELTLLCNEVVTAGDLQFGVAQNAIGAFRKSRALRELVESVPETEWAEMQLAMFDFLSRWTDQCRQLEESKFTWDPEASLDQQKPWYQEWFKSAPRDLVDASGNTRPPVQGTYAVEIETPEGKRLICANGLDCSRKLLEGTMGLASLAYYGRSLSPLLDEITSPVVFSPDSAAVACAQNNPWRQQHRANAYLAYGILSTIAFAALPVQGFIGVLPDARVPHHWKPEWTPNGELDFKPVYARKDYDVLVGVGTSSWVATPCELLFSTSTNGFTLSDPLFPAGFRAGACKRWDNTTIKVVSGTSTPKQKQGSLCFQCGVNVPQITQSFLLTLGKLTPPIKAAVQLVGTVAQWIRLRTDWSQMPRHQFVVPEHLTSSFLKNGTITKRCYRRLGKGKKCS